jgi:two-component system chemotaxis response regulator CheY
MALNILIVDDSATVRAIIAKAIRLAEVDLGELYEAANGREALDLLSEQWVDLVFADINMPVMGGIEMVERMRADALHCNTPIIIVSTEGSAERMRQLKEKGVNGYIRKPFTPEAIRNAIEEVIGNQDEN